MVIHEKQEKVATTGDKRSMYRCIKHILITSTPVLCFCSRAKRILFDKRSSMTRHGDLWSEANVHKCNQEPFWSNNDKDDEAELDT